MEHDEAYRRAEQKIEIARRSGAKELSLWRMMLTEIPISLSNLTQLEKLDLNANKLNSLPDYLRKLTNLQKLSLGYNELTELPEWVGQLTKLQNLELSYNKLTDLPGSIGSLKSLTELELKGNTFNTELSAAFQEGNDSLMRYLRAKAGPQVVLNEAKLILIGEGEVGKSCLLSALCDDKWEPNRLTTHGIEIKQFKATDLDSGKEVTLNGWDFGGQRVYRPTHQLFFSAPAVYLVVWKPREGPQQGFVKDWIRLVKHREPDAKILVVATHGGPGQRQPDIDRQELWDLFGRDTVIEFLHVDSKPDHNGERRGIAELKQSIARIANSLPEMGRTVPERWQRVREALQQNGEAYLSLEHVLKLCNIHNIDNEEARLFVAISHRLGHLIHYEHDPALQDIVVLKPDWLATAISFVLDDEQTRLNHGLVKFSRLRQLWGDPKRGDALSYPKELHPVFLRLMERFDLSYRVAGLVSKGNAETASLIAQLVPDNRPDPIPSWTENISRGDTQQIQICRIVDSQNGQSATAEGLFYQLIVRLHKYSLGNINYKDSVHWQRGLVLADDYNGRALLENISNDVRITVRAAYPERFLSVLTSEVKYLVESFWAGLRCEVMVPCNAPCGKDAPGTGLFEVEKLITFKRQGMTMFPCLISGCNRAQDIDLLLRNAPDIRPVAVESLFTEFTEVRRELVMVRQQLIKTHDVSVGRFDKLDINTQRILSKVDDAYTGLIQAFTDEAKDGPRLFSLTPIDRTVFNPKQWVKTRFNLILWCEHSRLPLPILNNRNKKLGVIELELTQEWFKKAAPFLKLITGTLSLVLPVASSAIKLTLDDITYKALEEHLDFGKACIDASITGGTRVSEWAESKDAVSFEHGEAIRAQGAILRELHALLKEKDPSFGGLVRVRNKRQEFLWVHEQFAGEY